MRRRGKRFDTEQIAELYGAPPWLIDGSIKRPWKFSPRWFKWRRIVRKADEKRQAE